MTRDRLLPFLTLSGLLLAGTIVLFWPAVHGEFLRYDDDVYVTENPAVRGGLSWSGVKWAFTSLHAVNWHPLTWLSHMLDVELFGADPWGHHLTSVLLHALNAVLLFGWVSCMTRTLVPAFLVAALFAAHPLRVESVAWVAERKDVLCACFGFGALWAWCGHAARGGAPRYVAALLLYLLSLLAKPMLVSLPFLLLLLDRWPLGRQERRPARTLLLEKAPFLALAAGVALVTLLAQSQGALRSLHEIPLWPRVLNSAIACFAYLGQAAWPSRLAVLYPHPGAGVATGVGVAALAALAASVVAVLRARRHPSLASGWLWYLIALLPVIGIVQVGHQSHADRYTYVPMVGVGLAVVFSLAQVTAHSRPAAAALVAAAVGLLALMAPLTRAQIARFRSTETLFCHTIAVTRGNAIAHTELAVLLASQGRADEARSHFDEALRIDPGYSPARSFLGKALVLWGRPAEAEALLREALERDPAAPRAHQHLGMALQRQGRWREAAEQYELALAREDARGAEVVRESLAAARRMDGDADGARRALEELVREHPGYPRGHLLLARALLQAGENGEALQRVDAALRLQPDWVDAHALRGIALYAQARFAESAESFRQALALDPRHAEAEQGLRRALERGR